MARRGRGEGSIRYRADGRWEVSVTLGDQRRSFYGKTRAEVTKKLTAAQRDFEQGQFIGDARQTVAQYLASWLETKRPPTVKAHTWAIYDSYVRVQINPVLGRVRLSQLSPQHIQQMTARALSHSLSPSTVSEVYGMLRQALKAAVRLGLIARDVTDQTDRPRRATREMRPLARDEAQRFIAVVATQRFARFSAFYNLALTTGMRIGELLAVKWRDVDLDTGRLSVVASLSWQVGTPIYALPKTRRSRRQIALAPYMVTMLREHRHQQRVLQVAAGPAWQGERFDAVFSDELGFPLQDSRIRRQFKAALAAADLPQVRFHDLRHTCATLLLQQRVNPKIVSELLGHSSVALTLDLYSHVHPDMQEEAARAMTTALGW
jgi:integrase